jgi:drug/metabolite transporter (DMT)-like permease
MSSGQSNTATISHGSAVLIIAAVAAIWGLGFPMTRFALDGGVSVGALMSVRFVLAGLLMAVIIRVREIPIVRRGLVDGVWLGLVLAAIFWLQTDGMRFTTTAKSGFITGLYVLFTPLVAVVAGQRVKLTSGVGALIASYGLYLLVRPPEGWGGHGVFGAFTGMNRGDFETLLCAILCAVHIVMMGAYTRRTDAWLLAGSQVMVCGLVSVVLTAVLPAPYGYQNLRQTLFQFVVLGSAVYLALFSTVFAFWGQALAQTRLGPAEAAVLFCIEPVSAAILSVFWLKEPITAAQVAGGTLIVVAMIVAEALPYVYRAITVPDTRP